MIWWILFAHAEGKQAPLMTGTGAADSLTVYVFLHDECMISQYYTLKLNQVYAAYTPKRIGFIGFFPSPSVSPDRIHRFANTYNIEFPIVSDYEKENARKYQAKVTPEVFVWDHRADMLIYRGRIDDSYVRVGKRKLHPQHDDLVNILNAWIDGQVFAKTVETQAIGCFINFDEVPKKQ